VHNTIEFEKRGIPATVIVTEAFKNTTVFQFRAKAMEGHPYIMLPHPVSNLTPDEMKQLTLRFVDEVAAHLKA
jgi:hypothetical protein